MTTLDRRIIFYFSGQDVTGHAAGMYPYYLKRFLATGGTSETIFVGNFYYNGVDTSVTFDVTDIISSDGFIVKEDDFQSVYSMNNKICNKYYLQVVWDAETQDWLSSGNQWVAKVSSYHNKNLNSYFAFTFFEPSIYTKDRVSVLQQGFVPVEGSDSALIPHYPMYDEEQAQYENDCPFAISLLVGDDIASSTLSFEVEGDEYDETVDYLRDLRIPSSGNSFTYISNISNVGYYRDIHPTSDGTLKLSNKQFVTSFFLASTPSDGTWLYKRYSQADRGNTYEYRYAYVLINNSHNKEFDDTSVNINNIDTTNILYCNVQIPNASYDAYTSGGTQWVVGDDGDYRHTFEYKVGILDKDYKRYYLFWQDRYGSFQCQAFNCNANYYESYDKSEIQDYQNRRRNSNIQIQSKWKLNSGWIPEDLYPYYESIYTSPLLILFDAAYNERYTVLVSGDYEEKTYRNQKKMINMNLELTENKKQNIIY